MLRFVAERVNDFRVFEFLGLFLRIQRCAGGLNFFLCLLGAQSARRAYPPGPRVFPCTDPSPTAYHFKRLTEPRYRIVGSSQRTARAPGHD